MNKSTIVTWLVCQLLVAISSAAAQMDSNYSLIFDPALKDLGVSYSEDKDNFYIHVAENKAAEAEKRVREIIGSKNGFSHHVLGSETLSQKAVQMAGGSFQDLNLSNSEDALKILHCVFGKKKFVDENEFWISGGSFNCGVLKSSVSSDCCTMEGLQNSYRLQLLNKTPEDLARAFNGDCVLAPHKGTRDKNAKLFGMAANCVQIHTTEDEDHRLAVDLEGIFNLAFAPKLKKDDLPNEVIFSLNHSHLARQFKKFQVDETLLRYVRHNDQVYCNPLVITEKVAATKPSYVLFIVDKSKSLNRVFANVKQELKTTIKKIWENDNSVKIRIAFFHESKQTKDFGSSNAKALEDFIDSQENNGGTRLFDTINEEIEELEKENLFDRFNVHVAIFTDGMNNIGSSEYKLPACLTAQSESEKLRLQSYVICFGRKYDRETLALIAKITCGQLYEVGNIENFKGILSGAIDTSRELRLENILINLKNEAIAACIPVAQNRPGIIDTQIYLPVGQSAPNEEKAGLANPEEEAKIKVSLAFFAAKQYLHQKNEAVLVDIKQIIHKLKQDNLTKQAKSVTDFLDVLKQYDNKEIEQSTAVGMLESKFHCFSR